LGVVCTIAVEEQRQKPDAANFNFAKIMQARDPAPGAAPERGNSAKRSNSRRLARTLGALGNG
ncbi:hypothetical protein ACMHYQ_18340, partial [Ectopseudomonas guguanensis]|uniref:hypothetical protein n=1 Tax=Ectopseudomonas guguanensis TaxID=1198456 RepID=UPI0039C05EF7